MQRKFDKKIGLIPCAFGGTSLSEWEKGEFLYTNAVSSTLEAIKYSQLKGILWHQGESDADRLEMAQSYKERFLLIIESLLADIGFSNTPIVLGELGEFLVEFADCSYSDVVNEKLKEISNENDYFAFISAKELTDNGDFLHFNSKSLRQFGQRYATAWEECARTLGVMLI